MGFLRTIVDVLVSPVTGWLKSREETKRNALVQQAEVLNTITKVSPALADAIVEQNKQDKEHWLTRFQRPFLFYPIAFWFILLFYSQIKYEDGTRIVELYFDLPPGELGVQMLYVGVAIILSYFIVSPLSQGAQRLLKGFIR